VAKSLDLVIPVRRIGKQPGTAPVGGPPPPLPESRRGGCSENGYEVVEVADVPTVEVVELGDVGAEPTVVVLVVLGLVADGGRLVVVVLLGLVVVVEGAVVVDLGGGVVVVVVVVVVGTAWETGLEPGEGRGGYWMYRAPNPRKATAINAVDRRTGNRRLRGRLMKPRNPFRLGRSGRGPLARFDHAGRSRRLASNGMVPSSSVTAPSSSHRPWAAS
jgi:hypothetical protein